MRVIVKPGVIIAEINARLFHVCITVSSVFEEYGFIPVMTSASDGVHMPTSLHYKHLGWDFRLRHVPIEYRLSIVDKIQSILNVKTDDYDVILEKNKDTEWVHIEYDPHKIKEA
jgi:hypothetical protein